MSGPQDSLPTPRSGDPVATEALATVAVEKKTLLQNLAREALRLMYLGRESCSHVPWGTEPCDACVIELLLSNEAVVRRALGIDETCALCDHDEWIHNLHGNGRCIPECGCKTFTREETN